MNFVNEDNDCIGLGSGESSGSSSLPTTWWEVWEQFSKTKCLKAPPLVDSACPNPWESYKRSSEEWKIQTRPRTITDGTSNKNTKRDHALLPPLPLDRGLDSEPGLRLCR
jgi:hypothetical protein